MSADRVYARALYDFNPENEEQLAFKKGDKILLYSFDKDEEWWEGAIDGDESRTGMFRLSVVPKTIRSH